MKRSDKARLDWLEENYFSVALKHPKRGWGIVSDNLRQAIDRAMYCAENKSGSWKLDAEAKARKPKY